MAVFSLVNFSRLLASHMTWTTNRFFSCVVSIIFFLLTACSFSRSAYAQSSKQIFSKSLSELTIDVLEVSPSQYEISLNVLKAQKTPIEAEVQYIPNPTRLVIDVKGSRISKNQSFTVSHSIVKGVRLGIHPSHTRIVLDISSASIVSTATRKGSNNSFNISFVVPGSGVTGTESVEQEKTAELPKLIETPAVTVLATKTAQATKGAPTAAATTTKIIPTATRTAVSTATATPTKEATKTKKSEPTTIPVQKTQKASETEVAEKSSAELNVRKVPEVEPTATKPAATATSTKTAKPTKTATPQPTPSYTPTRKSTATPKTTATPLPKSAPLSSLLEQHRATEGESTIDGGTFDKSDTSIGPVGGTQYLADLRFDYQIQNHEPLLRLVMMSSANFNLVKKDSVTYELLIPQAGIKAKSLAQPHFPPHDFVGFTLVYPRYADNTLTIEIKVDRGARITAFARGNEIWIRSTTK